ncbi:MAG: hypothetical protein J7M19_06895, partial [Planctomycetes bacterium]|nr:hypothetical protein [Planctomycetota bacterium]
LAAAGLVFSLRRPGVWFVLAQAAVYSAAIILFVVVGRYRLAIVPLILPTAGFALAEMVICVRDLNFAKGLGILIPAVAVCLPVNYQRLTPFARERRNPTGFEITQNGSLTVHDDSNYPTPFGVRLQGNSLALKFLLLDEIPPGATRSRVLVRLRVGHAGTLKVCLNNHTQRLPLTPSGATWLKVSFPTAAVSEGLNSISLRAEDALVARIYADDAYNFKRSIYSPDGRTGRSDRLDRDTYRRCPSLHMGAHELKVRLELTTPQPPPSSRLSP